MKVQQNLFNSNNENQIYLKSLKERFLEFKDKTDKELFSILESNIDNYNRSYRYAILDSISKKNENTNYTIKETNHDIKWNNVVNEYNRNEVHPNIITRDSEFEKTAYDFLQKEFNWDSIDLERNKQYILCVSNKEVYFKHPDEQRNYTYDEENKRFESIKESSTIS